MVHDINLKEGEFKVHEVKFHLWPAKWKDGVYLNNSLKWIHVKFEEKNKNSIPSEKGLYCFCVEPKIAGLNQLSYLMYIGQTGHNSNSHLRKRFSDYLYEKKRDKRHHIYKMLNRWSDSLCFYYTTLKEGDELKKLETSLLDCFIPPFNDDGFSGKLGSWKKF